jgi:hypothetical protein
MSVSSQHEHVSQLFGFARPIIRAVNLKYCLKLRLIRKKKTCLSIFGKLKASEVRSTQIKANKRAAKTKVRCPDDLTI